MADWEKYRQIAQSLVSPLSVGPTAPAYGKMVDLLQGAHDQFVPPPSMADVYSAANLLPVGRVGPRSAVLPMDTASRMARATEQGYTIDAYKGMYPYDWRTVPERYGSGKIVPGTEGRVPQEITSINSNAHLPEPGRGAGFFSDSPEVASRFAQAMGEGSVFPTKLKMENPKVIDAGGRYAADFQFGPQGNQLLLPKDSPHDGVILRNTKDEGTIYIPRTPDQIRGRFAAFDPASKGSGALLGSMAGIAAVLNGQSGDNP